MTTVIENSTQATPQLDARFIQVTQELPYEQLPFALNFLKKMMEKWDMEKEPNFQKFLNDPEQLLIELNNILNKLIQYDWEKKPDLPKYLDDPWKPLWHEIVAKKERSGLPKTEAGRLQEISGLDTEQLAEIFAVSPQTYNGWLAGFPVPDEYRERLVAILEDMEKAYRRLKSAEATKAWLLTPVFEGSETPLAYLIAREDNIFGGLVLHISTGQSAFSSPIRSSGWVNAMMTPEEFEANLERRRRRKRGYPDDYAHLDETKEAS